MADKGGWVGALKEHLHERVTHNTAAALRVREDAPPANGGDKKPKSLTQRAHKTYKTSNEKLERPGQQTYKTHETPEDAARLGMVATWSHVFGYVSIHDPTTGEWYDVPTNDAPGWAKREAFKRKQLYKGGNRRAYRLSRAEMEELWESEQAEMWNEPHRPEGAKEGLVYDAEEPEDEGEDASPTVVHPYDCELYIGRKFYDRHARIQWEESDWHNPNPLPEKPTEGQVRENLKAYEAHVRANLWDRLPELAGLRLGCYCKKGKKKHEPCHGDVLVELFLEKMNLA